MSGVRTDQNGQLLMVFLDGMGTGRLEMRKYGKEVLNMDGFL